MCHCALVSLSKDSSRHVMCRCGLVLRYLYLFQQVHNDAEPLKSTKISSCESRRRRLDRAACFYMESHVHNLPSSFEARKCGKKKGEACVRLHALSRSKSQACLCSSKEWIAMVLQIGSFTTILGLCPVCVGSRKGYVRMSLKARRLVYIQRIHVSSALLLQARVIGRLGFCHLPVPVGTFSVSSCSSEYSHPFLAASGVQDASWADHSQRRADPSRCLPGFHAQRFDRPLDGHVQDAEKRAGPPHCLPGFHAQRRSVARHVESVGPIPLEAGDRRADRQTNCMRSPKEIRPQPF